MVLLQLATLNRTLGTSEHADWLKSLRARSLNEEEMQSWPVLLTVEPKYEWLQQALGLQIFRT